MVNILSDFAIASGVCFGALVLVLIVDSAVTITIDTIKTLTKRVFWDE
jgi:hypothetical protein